MIMTPSYLLNNFMKRKIVQWFNCIIVLTDKIIINYR